MTRFRLIAFAAATLLATACAKPQVTTSPEVTEASVRPTGAQSVEDALKAAGLSPLELKEVATAHGTGTPMTTKPGQFAVSYTDGWNTHRPFFARRASDGAIVRVIEKPNVIVDRHVDGGCLRFAGGRQESLTGVFELPAGATYAGEVDVVYDKHTEVTDYSNDPSCPPPALD